MARGSAAAVVTVMTTAAVSVNGMRRPPVLVTLGRRPVVPGVGWVGSGDVVHLLGRGQIGPHGLAASTSSWFVVVRGRGVDGGIDYRRGLGDEPRSDHAGGTSIVGHVGTDGASVRICSSGGTLYVSLWSGSPPHEIKSG